MIHAKQALTTAGWRRDVRLTVQDGHISEVELGHAPQPGDTCVDTLLPALSNLHSHTFQRAMAGMSEQAAAGRDSFWTWRVLMYRFMDRLSPDQIEAIAAFAFMEMQEAGFGAVAEFHYVHHQTGGQAYAQPGELSARIFEAAKTTGIGLTHLPVLYTYGGTRAAALADGQLRFGNTLAQFEALLGDIRQAMSGMPADAQLGIAPHSLRATTPQDLSALLAQAGSGPIHMHIAEQPKEVADIQDWLGARPVEWLLDNAEVDARWCLIHASHMTQAETQKLARSGAVAGLCPMTEANLGDGPFNGPAYLGAGGAYGIGTDSNIRISVAEELRMLEYAQRMRDLGRNIWSDSAAQSGAVSTGHALYCGAARGGAQALGRNSGDIAVGKLADLVAIDSQDPSLCALAPEHLIDGMIFAAPNVVREVWSAGRHCVTSGQHVARESVVQRYRAALLSLTSTL